MGLQWAGQVKWRKLQQIVFVGGTCGSIHVESFNRNVKALGFLESRESVLFVSSGTPFARNS
jgi:hypothetical protein